MGRGKVQQGGKGQRREAAAQGAPGVHTAGAKALGWDLVHRLGVVEEPVELMQSEGVGDGEPWQGWQGLGGGVVLEGL